MLEKLFNEDFEMTISDFVENIFSDEMLGHIVDVKRVYRKNGKKRYYKYQKYYPGILDYIPGGKKILRTILRRCENDN